MKKNRLRHEIVQLRTVIIILAVSLTTVLISGCGDNVDCQSPPPVFFFQIKNNGIIYPSKSDSTATVSIYYTDAKQAKAYVTDVKRYGDFFETSMIISRSRELKDPEFTIEFKGDVFAKMKLETYINNSNCNGWSQISKVYQNGVLLSPVSNGIYQFGKE